MAFTMRALGYPSREALTDWIDELHPELRRKLVTKATNVPHTPAQKAAAVLDLCTRQTSADAIAKTVAVSRYTLYKWKNQLLGREAPTSMKEKTTDIPDVDAAQLSELQQQVVSLQRDIRRMQLEHDILKLVAAPAVPPMARPTSVEASPVSKLAAGPVMLALARASATAGAVTVPASAPAAPLAPPVSPPMTVCSASLAVPLSPHLSAMPCACASSVSASAVFPVALACAAWALSICAWSICAAA